MYKMLVVLVSCAILFLSVGSCASEKIKSSDHIDELNGVDIQGVPCFSVDGNKMVFVDSDSKKIKVHNWSDGSSLAHQFAHPVYSPRLSPDGSHIFYLQISSEGYFSELWMLNLTNGDKKKITDEVEGDVSSFEISPDGKNLAFMAFNDSRNSESLFFVNLKEPFSIVKVDGNPDILYGVITLVFSLDGKSLFFPYGSKIYKVDLNEHRYVKNIDIGRTIHYFTSGCLFVAFEQGFYQIFRFDEAYESIKQLTFDQSNKLQPKLQAGEELYYIDAGKQISAHKLSLNKWFMERNSTSTFKDYLNNWGRLAWDETSTLKYLLKAYEIFDDQYFLQTAAMHITSILDSMDIEKGIKDYAGVSTYGWSSTRYSLDKKSNMRFLIHDGLIGSLLAEFVLLVDNKATDETTKALVARSKYVLAKLVASNAGQWRNFDSDKFGIIQRDEGYYLIPYASPAGLDGANAPFNYQSGFSRMLLLLHEISGQDDYLDKALRMGRLLRRHLVQDVDGFKWYYWWGKGFEGWTKAEGVSVNTPSYPGHKGTASIGYATIDVEFMTKLASYGVLSADDMLKLSKTYLNKDSVMQFQEVKVGSLLSKYAPKIVTNMRSIKKINDIFLEDLPILSSYQNAQNAPGWDLVVVNLGTGEKKNIDELPNAFVSFIVKDASLAIIFKDKGMPYKARKISRPLSS